MTKAQNSFIAKTTELLSSLDGVRVIPYKTTEDGLEYLATQFLKTQHSIDQAALAPSALYRERIGRKYEQATEAVLKNPKVKYRYIAVFDRTRWTRVKKHLPMAATGRYFVRYFRPNSDHLPTLSFAVFDNSEVLVRYPYRPGEDESWVSITHPEVVNLFVSYYNSMWNASLPLEIRDSKTINEIEAAIFTVAEGSEVIPAV